jgi:heat shock protein HtpX
VIGYAVDRALSRGDSNSGPGIGYMITVIVSQIVLGIGASMIVAWFSRHREFRADAGSAKLLGSTEPMVRALQRLAGMTPNSLPQSMASMGISDKPGFMALFSTHPPMEQRIAELRAQR